MKLRTVAFVAALALPLALPAMDEGLWLFNLPPKDAIKQKYSFEPTGDFLEHLRLASVRIGSGSGGFVSPQGLLVTTHRIASDCIAKAGGAQHDYFANGFYAAAPSAELPCPQLDAAVLVAIEDVSQKVKDASKDTPKPTDALEKRTAAIARMEKECAGQSGNACSVVKLFAGERYDLYQYKRYSDIRLVFAPESGIALFGGDADRFNYPRYSLDVAFLRAYENAKPALTPQYLKWSADGVKDTDLVFVAGNPERTTRLSTQSQFAFYRDTQLPVTLTRLMSRIELVRDYAAKSADNRRASQRTLQMFASAYKSSAGKLLGLKDDRLTLRKQQFERRLRRLVEGDPKLGAPAAKVWDDVAAAYRAWAPSEKAFQVLERQPAPGSELFRLARTIVRLNEERSKPDAKRLAEFREDAIQGVQFALESPVPIDEGLEIALLTQYFEELKVLGDKEAPVKAVLEGRTPQQAAEAIVKASKVKDPGERKRLAADPKGADSMIKLAQAIDGPARKLRKKYEDAIEALEASATDRIAQYRFKVLAGDYPDATSTARLSFGAVKGYRDKTEAPLPFATTFGGMYHRAGKEEPYVLPQRWVDAKSVLDLVAPFDFVSTCDISNGSSGSPTVNKAGELVGMVFDGNIESLPGTYLYTEDQARAVHVASQGIVEALLRVYPAPELLRELGVLERSGAVAPVL